MEYSFICYGNKNITAKHKTTLELTKDKDVSLKGDCIIGVGADFSLKEIKKFVKDKANANKKTMEKIPIKIIIGINNLKEEINGFLNAGFDDHKEIVVRKSDFKSKRTLVFLADKGAFELNRDLIGFLKEEKNKINVIIKNK